MKATILYAEDEENDAIFMELALARIAPQVRLVVVQDGREALDYLGGEGPYVDRARYPLPTLVLLDFNLPLLSGLDVVHWMRQRREFDATPIVLFSSSGRLEDRDVARLLGANHYLVKPMSGEQFTQIARELTERWLVRVAG